MATSVTARIARGRLEVETDVLLGVDDVLLPTNRSAGAQPSAAPAASDERAPARATMPLPSVESTGSGRKFESDLFDPVAGARSSGGWAPTAEGTRRAAPTSASRVIEPKQPPRPEIDGWVPPAERDSQVGSAQVPAPDPFGGIPDRVGVAGAGSKAERLSRLEADHASRCPHCTTATAHTRLVFGEGNPDAEIVFVGEAPGEMEDAAGRPFVGRAGEKLDEMIVAMGLRREDVYIANCLKSRPPDNRTPLAHEVEQCGPYLLAQLAIVRPKVIVTLGGPATKLLLRTDQGITRMRGLVSSVRLGEADRDPFEVSVVPTFHPAYLLRNYTVETRRQMWADLKQALAIIGREPPPRPAPRE